MKRNIALFLLIVLTALTLACQSEAPTGESTTGTSDSDWPKSAVTLVVPFGAGGDTDTYCRLMAQKLEKILGEPFVVVNTVGGSGIVASNTVLNAKNDGYTALFHHTGVMLTQEASGETDFSFIDDFATVATIAQDNTYALVAKKSSGWETLEDMIAYAKENPGQLRYSITYNGATHYIAERIEETMGIELNHLDVGAGAADRLAAFMGDQVDLLVVNYMNIADYVENGDFVVYGISAPERQPGLEDVPTLSEQGYDIVLAKSYEVKLPPQTDQAIVDKLSNAMQQITQDEEFIEALAKYYAQPFFRDAATTKAQDREEVERLKAVFE